MEQKAVTNLTIPYSIPYISSSHPLENTHQFYLKTTDISLQGDSERERKKCTTA